MSILRLIYNAYRLLAPSKSVHSDSCVIFLYRSFHFQNLVVCAVWLNILCKKKNKQMFNIVNLFVFCFSFDLIDSRLFEEIIFVSQMVTTFYTFSQQDHHNDL